MTTHYLNNQTFYVLSGPSASGKSFLTNQLLSQGLSPDAIVSSDTIRRNILGFKTEIDEYGIREAPYGWTLNNPQIFEIIEKILSLRFLQKLPTIFDATNLNDKDREWSINIAKKFNIPSKVLIFNPDEKILKERLSKRAERFDYKSVENQLSKFQRDSVYSFETIENGDKIVYKPVLLPTSNLLLVGDTHGMLKPLKEFLLEQGFSINNEGFSHPEKKIVFLGDVLDRGEDSLELLKLVIKTVENNHGFFILGNHETKLLLSYEKYLEDGTVKGKSLSSSQTFMKFLALPEKEQTDIYRFLLNSPFQLTLWVNKKNLDAIGEKDEAGDCLKFGMVHANNSYYHPLRIPRAEALYGHTKSKLDSDKIYEEGFLKGLNDHVLFRGHTKHTSNQAHVYSLEDDQAFDGNLMFLDMKTYLENLKKNNFTYSHDLFERATMKKKTNYNFDEKNKETVQLLKGLQALQKEGLVNDGVKKNPDTGEKIMPPDGLRIYKYAKKVHFKKLWKTNPLLEKARGLVLDDAGNIIVHPFDKIYNYEEYDTGKDVKPEQKVYCVEKLNGFLGCISKHPFKNELLLSTTGSLTSDYIGYINDFITDDLRKKLLNYFKENNKTLMFEVLHPQDNENHIVPYEKEELGLWLIGARGRNLSDKIESEEYLDKIGDQLGLKRPHWEIMSFSEILEKTKDSQLEGYMVRDAQSHQTLMKIKTNHYLVTKFLGRMAPSKVEMMFTNPEKFKQNHVEEEFYSLVDSVVKQSSQEQFLKMEQPERVSFVRELIVNQRKDNNKKITP